MFPLRVVETTLRFVSRVALARGGRALSSRACLMRPRREGFMMEDEIKSTAAGEENQAEAMRRARLARPRLHRLPLLPPTPTPMCPLLRLPHPSTPTVRVRTERMQMLPFAANAGTRSVRERPIVQGVAPRGMSSTRHHSLRGACRKRAERISIYSDANARVLRI